MRTGSLLWVPSAVLVQPVDTTIVCDTGALQAGDWLFAVAGSCDVSFRYQVKAITLATLLADRRPAAGDVDWLQPSQVRIPQSESVRVLIVGTTLATLQLTLYGWLL